MWQPMFLVTLVDTLRLRSLSEARAAEGHGLEKREHARPLAALSNAIGFKKGD